MSTMISHEGQDQTADYTSDPPKDKPEEPTRISDQNAAAPAESIQAVEEQERQLETGEENPT